MKIFKCCGQLKAFYITLPLFLFCSCAFAQITVTTSTDPALLINKFMGNSITVVGTPTKYCHSEGMGFFGGGYTTSCPIDSGIILCTGYSSFLNRPVDFTCDAGLNYGSTDADLQTLTTQSITDICYIEFDFIPKFDSVSFEYVFGSEEYLEWVGSVFNDVFGFFVTGPKPGGGSYNKENLALVPGSNDIVSINTINTDSNSAFYINNYNTMQDPGIDDSLFVLDGFTVNMQIGLDVIPCSTYSLKMAICDASDPVRDSYVLLKCESFSSPGLSVSIAAQDSVTEGQNADFIFSFPYVLASDTVIYYTVLGTATQGSDYTLAYDSIIIYAGDSLAILSIPTIVDGVTPEAPESVIITISEQTSCLNSSDSATIFIKDFLCSAIADAGSDTTICEGAPVTITAAGGISYLWDNGLGAGTSHLVSPLSNTVYVVTVTDAMSCTATDDVTVFVNTAPTADAGLDSGICPGDSVSIIASGGIAYQWDNGLGTDPSCIVSPLMTTTYNVTVTDANGCTDNDDVIVEIFAVPAVDSLIVSNATCGVDNGSIISQISGGSGTYFYLWSNDSVTDDIYNLAPGSYIVTVTDGNGCQITDSTVVSFSMIGLSVNASNTDITCFGYNDGTASALVSTPGTYNYLWSNSDTIPAITGLNAGVYYITITDSIGCMGVDSVTVLEPSALNVVLSGDFMICYGGSNGFCTSSVSGGTQPYTYQWSVGGAQESIFNLAPGDIYLTVTDDNSCQRKDTATITASLQINYSENIIHASCIGSSDGQIVVTMLNGSSPFTYMWSDALLEGDSVNGLKAGKYEVTITDANGCQVIEEFEVFDGSLSCLEIPNIFTPNGDGANDTWQLPGIEYYPEAKVEIYNRWGDLIFESDGYSEPWDGTYNGKELPISSFVYIVYLNDGSQPIQGIVTIKK